MLRFAVPGAPFGTPKPGGSLKGIAFAHSIGINAMEMEWVQSVPKNPAQVAEVGALAKKLDVALTVHAPFFINLNSDDTEKLAASKKRILDALTMAQIAGAVSVCVHAAFYNGRQHDALDNVRRATNDILKKKSKLFPDVNLGYETMGKHSQFGTMDEVLAVSKEFDLYPVIDFAHMHARANGGINSTKEWNEMFDQYAAALGKKSLKNMHIHYCGIAYGEKGEKHHLPLPESDAKWKDFLKVLKDRAIGGIVVCESPVQETDTLLLQRYFDGL